MEAVLLEFLHRLEAIGDEHGELFDSEVRDAMSRAVMKGFIRPEPDYTLPPSFKMFTTEADEQVRATLAWFLPIAHQAAAQYGLDTFHKRLTAFQNPNICTKATNYYDDFFGWWNPDQYDEHGNLQGR